METYVYTIEKSDGDGGVYGFLFLSRATNRGSNSWKFNKRVRTSTLTHHWSCWIAMEVIVEDQSIAFATVNLCIYNRAVCHYTIRDRMQMNWLKYSYSMHFLLVSVILFQVLVFFPPYLFIPRKRCKRRKKKNIIWFYRIVFRIKNATRIVQFFAKTTFPWIISFFFLPS